jgi:hypothetical protein
MDSSDGAQKQVQMTVRKKKKRHPAPIDSAMYQALVDQLDNTTLEAQRSQNKTIEALDQAMTEIRALRAQVESLQATQGSLAGNLDLTTSRVATVEITLHQHGQKLQEVQNRQATMVSQWDAFQQKWKDGASGAINPQQEAGHLTDFFLGGIPQLRQAIGLPPHSDPVEVVATMLKTLSLYCSVDRIFVADNAAQNRSEARAVVLRMRSSFHKRDTMVKVKQFLATRQVRDATVRDCFPAAAMEVARNLNRYGGHLRRSQGYQRYRVIADRDGHPILQVAKQGTGYQDYTVSQAEMAAFLKDLNPAPTRQQQQRSSNRGKTGPGHQAKNKPAPAILLSTANSTPQAPTRQTSHLMHPTTASGRPTQPLLPLPSSTNTQLATTVPDMATQRALQDQYLQQQQAYQLQQQQQHQHFLMQQQQRQLYDQQQQLHQQHYQQQQEIQGQLLQQHQQAPLLAAHHSALHVPQPGTDAAVYDSQWPPLPTVTVMPSSMATTAASSMMSHSQQAYGRPSPFQAQGAGGAATAVPGNLMTQDTAPSSSGRSSIDRNG